MTPRPRIPRRLLLLATAIAVTVAVGACGSSGNGSATSGGQEVDSRSLTATVPPAEGTGSSTTDPALETTTTGGTEDLPAACTLLTGPDVAAAFGEPAVAGDQRADECWWSSTDDLKTVNLIRRTDDVTTWRSGYDNEFWTPNDLADEGFTGTALDSVVWRVGDVQYELNVVYSTSGDPRQVATDLAEKVAARL